MRKLDQNRDGYVAMPEFVLLSRHFPEMLLPVKRVRKLLRKKTVHSRFWRQITRRRVNDFGNGTIFTIAGIADREYVSRTVEYLNLQHGEVPPQFVEQYALLRRKKAASLRGDIELPYEVASLLAAKKLPTAAEEQQEEAKQAEEPQLSLEDFLPGAATQALTEHKADEGEDVVADSMLRVRLKGGRPPKAPNSRDKGRDSDEMD